MFEFPMWGLCDSAGHPWPGDGPMTLFAPFLYASLFDWLCWRDYNDWQAPSFIRSSLFTDYLSSPTMVFGVPDSIALRLLYLKIVIFMHVFVFRLKSDKKQSVISCRECNGEVYRHAFTGSRLVSWFIDSDECKTRQDGVNLGRRLLENDIIRHGE